MWTFWDFSTFVATFLYGLLYNRQLLCVWLGIFCVYQFCGLIWRNNPENSTRRTIRIASWNPPSDPNVLAKIEILVAKLDEFIRLKKSQGVELNYTDFALKATGMAFQDSLENCGKIVFGRVLPYTGFDSSLHVQRDDGSIAILVVPDCDKKSVRELSEYVRVQSKALKSESGSRSIIAK